MKKIIVTGGRDYKDAEIVNRTLTCLAPDMIIEGGAAGADSLGRLWAKENGILCQTFRADWNMNGRAAGPIRNRQMLAAHPDATVVAFPGGRGTENCVATAKLLGHTVLRIT